MAESKTYQEHQESLLNMRSRPARLSYALQHFSDIRKSIQRKNNPNKRGGGKTFEGLHWLEGIDLDTLAVGLSQYQYSGKKATSQAFRMGEHAFALMKVKDFDHRDKWFLGRVILSAYTYAGIYQLKRIDDHGDAPYYIMDGLTSIQDESPPENTRHEPYPKWTKNIDEFGNRLVKPSYPCPREFEFEPNLKGKNLEWLDAVHKLESTPFQINKEVLEWANNKTVKNKFVPSIPKGYKKDREALDKDYDKIKRLEEKHDKKKRNEGLTKSELPFWKDWWHRHSVLEAKRVRFESKRNQFQRQLDQANRLAKDGRPFYHRVSLDYRGRVYLPSFSYQGSDFCRAVIEFADTGVMTKPATIHFARHTTNVIGKTLPYEDKLHYGREESLQLANLALDPLSKETFKKLEGAEKPFGMFRCGLEWRNVFVCYALDHPRELPKDILKVFKELYAELPLKTIKTKKYNGQELYKSKTNKHVLSHLPISADHRNSAFQHIGMMVDNDDGEELIRRCGEEDLYQFIASQSDLPPEHSRALVKMVMVPWSYGGSEYSCREKILEWRLENPKVIPHLDDLDYQGVYDLVREIFSLLNTNFPACGAYQRRVKNAVQSVKDDRPTRSTDGIEWTSPSGFVVHQAVFNTDRAPNYVWDGVSKDVQLIARMPNHQMNWAKMKTKAPPNLVHSVDASVVHMFVKGSVHMNHKTWKKEKILTFDPLVTVHDSFSVVPSDAADLLWMLQQVTYSAYWTPPLGAFIADINGIKRPKDPKEHHHKAIQEPAYS